MDAPNETKRFQFGLQALLVVTTCVACVCALLKILPTNLSYFLVSALLFATLCSLIHKAISSYDRKIREQDELLAEARGSLAMIACSLTIVLIVITCSILQLPGRRGTVQLFATHPLSMFVFTLRSAVMLTMLVSPFVSMGIGFSQQNIGRIPRSGWFVLATLSYFVAGYTIGTFEFFPLA